MDTVYLLFFPIDAIDLKFFVENMVDPAQCGDGINGLIFEPNRKLFLISECSHNVN